MSTKRTYSQYSNVFGTAARLADYERMLKRPASRFVGAARPVGRAFKGSYSAAKGAPKSYRVRAPAGLKSAVKAIIAADKEQKVEVSSILGGGITALLVTDNLTAPTFAPLLPELAGGNSAETGTRIGNEVMVTRSYVKFTLSLPLDATSNPYIVTLWIGKLRGEPAKAPSLNDYNELLLAAGGGPIGPDTAFRVSNAYPVNQDEWDIKVRKVYKLGKAARSDSTSNPTANNDFNLCYQDEIDITRFMKRKLLYDSSTNQYPSNDGLYMFFTFTTLDDSDPAGSFPNVSGVVVTRYTDA